MRFAAKESRLNVIDCGASQLISSLSPNRAGSSMRGVCPPRNNPVELFLDPDLSSPKLAIGMRLLMRSLGFRALMDVIPLDASLVKGSHGRVTNQSGDGPLMISDQSNLNDRKNLRATDVKQLLLDAIFAS
jgi:hypothetical protein